MGAVAKNVISQLMPAAAEQVPGVFLNDSVAPMLIMGLKYGVTKTIPAPALSTTTS
jgi:hypothetical protein